MRIADPGSRTYGSGWTRDRARELGKRTIEHQVRTRAGEREIERRGIGR